MEINMDIVKLDCRGKCCPEPLTELRNAVRKGQPGQLFEKSSSPWERIFQKVRFRNLPGGPAGCVVIVSHKKEKDMQICDNRLLNPLCLL